MVEEFEVCMELINTNLDNLNADDLSLFFGKKGKKNNKRHYGFNEGMKNLEVSRKLLSFLKNNFKTLTESTVKADFNENEPDNYIYFNLEDIEVWGQFEPVVYRNVCKFKDVDDDELERFNKNFRTVTSLKKLKYQINHYLLIHESQDCILGQISKIYPKQVLFEHKLNFIFKKDKFTDVRSEPNIEIDEHDSILFFINKDLKMGFTKNKKEYEDIFDMNIQYKLDALNVVKNSKFNEYCDKDKVKEIIDKDLTIQRMLNNPVTKFAFDNFDINNFSTVYQNISENNSSHKFGFEFKDNQFIIDSNNERESLREIIKYVGHYYNYSLDEDMIVEGIPKNIFELSNADE